MNGDLVSKISTALLNQKWLKKNQIEESLIKNFIDSKPFKKQLEVIIKSNDFSCMATLDLSMILLKTLQVSKTPENWLNYLLNYTLEKSYPNAVDLELYDELAPACEIFLRILNVISEYQKSANDNTWQSIYPLKFLTPTEEDSLENPSEYKNFIKAFQRDYAYEMMKIHQEISGYNTLDHICGVHHLALFIARQIAYAGVSVDLGRVSGAAAGHDIGKYGCTKSELKRVPYLHYYYTDYWFKKHNIPYIGHVAVNHSTWDLELENLPLESLILIYADFRVKNIQIDNKYIMHIFSLSDSFDVILQKLDNVDSKKEARYKRVYAKLKDFEEYLTHLGVNVDINSNSSGFLLLKQDKVNYSLMHGNDITNNYKYLSIEHSANLMYRLRDEYSLNVILEQARSLKNWEKLREYLQVFEEYSTYLTQRQKLIMLKFLYDQLIHPEGDIRRQCAELMGIIIAVFDEDYRKELPDKVTLEAPEITSLELLDKYINIFLHPDHKIVSGHRVWIGYSLSIMISSLFSHCQRAVKPDYINVLINYFKINTNDSEYNLFLLETAKFLPKDSTSNYIERILNYLFEILQSEEEVLRLDALEVICSYLDSISTMQFELDRISMFLGEHRFTPKTPHEKYLYTKMLSTLGLDLGQGDTLLGQKTLPKGIMSDFYLSNLKSATHPIFKRIQIEILLNNAVNNIDSNSLYTALHFCNILKVSALESVRNYAGEALITLIPYLSLEQRNDVAVELIRALEIDGYQYAKYIPNYLGRVILFLQPRELDEVIDDFVISTKQSNLAINSLLLKTLGIAISNFTVYKDNFNEDNSLYEKRLEKMLGILLNGLANYNNEVKQIALGIIGKDIFSSRSLTLEEKNKIFVLISKKILSMLTFNVNSDLLFFMNSIVLNHIYKFIADYSFFVGDIKITSPCKIAFFPGTFDPFSLSHKEIAKVIRDMGFEVYLAVDEFSWSKQTLPTSLRRNIISMSISDELNIFLYPMDTPTNIANSEDIKLLKDSFGGSNLYMVAGSDVIINASSYKIERRENSIHTLSHIIFDRRNANYTEEQEALLDTALTKIEGEIVRLALPTQYEDISSTQIRNYIDDNKDITSLVDPLAQKYIYERSFYRREPQYKTLIQPISIDIEVVENITPDILEKLLTIFPKNPTVILDKLKEFSGKNNARFLLVKDILQGNRLLGFSAFHWVRSNSLYNDFKNGYVSEYIRENGVGRIILIDGIYIDKNLQMDNLEQILLTETLTFCIAKDYDYAVFQNIIGGYYSHSLYELLELHGFTYLPYGKESNPIYVVNMNTPSTLNLDIKSMIKEPYKNSKSVTKAIINVRKRLQRALVKIYPGNLVLSFDMSMLHNTLVKKICEENGVQATPIFPRSLGDAICVPFGNILKKQIIPNTITKALHTEKLFEPDMRSSRIGPYPYYMPLETQLKMIHSFNKPIILVDDLLHNGYRASAIFPLLQKENITVQKTIVGVLSAKGKELMDTQNMEIDSAYFIPRLRVWFNECAQYPFIGGDTLWRGTYPEKYLIPSVNLILPYTSPTFLRHASKDAIYNLSQTCIENSIEILIALEKEYQSVHERSLTLSSLGDVFVSPRYPDHGKDIKYDFNLNPSHYLENDLEQLIRMEHIINRL